MAKSASKPGITIRDLETRADLDRALRLEKEVWKLEDADGTPLTLAVASRAAGSVWVGAFEDSQLVGFAFALPSLEQGRIGLRSHPPAGRTSHRSLNLGSGRKRAHRQRART